MRSVDQWLDERKKLLTREVEDREPTWKKITVRLDQDLVDKIDYVARQTILSRTACAEELLAVAIRDAYEAVLADKFFGSLEVEERGLNMDQTQEFEELIRDGVDPEEAVRRVTGKAVS